MANNDVIRSLKRKAGIGFGSIINIGTEQRFVTPLTNSGVNNLEEQLIFGTDTYKEISYNSNGDKVITTSYHVNSDSHENLTNYYKIVTTIDKDYVIRDAYFNNKRLYLINKNPEASDADFVTIQTDELYFVSNNTETLILTKYTKRKYTAPQGSAVGGTEIIKEEIVNHLTS